MNASAAERASAGGRPSAACSSLIALHRARTRARAIAGDVALLLSTAATTRRPASSPSWRSTTASSPATRARCRCGSSSLPGRRRDRLGGVQRPQSYLTSWVGERILTDLRVDLFEHVQRLDLGFYERTRAGVAHLAPHERRRGAGAARHRRPHHHCSRTPHADRLRADPALPGLAAGAGHADRVPGHGDRHRAVPPLLVRAYRRTRERLAEVTASLQEDLSGVRVVQAFGREEPNRAAFREVNGAYREANVQTVSANALYFPVVDLLSTIGHGGRARLRRLAGNRRPDHDRRRCWSSSATCVLLRAGAAAVPVLQDVPGRDRRRWTRSSTCWTRSPTWSTARTRSTCRRSRGEVEFDGRPLRLRPASGPVLHGLDLRRRGRARRSRWSATPAPASRPSSSCWPGSTTRSRGRVLIDGHDLRDVTQASLRRQLGDRAAGGLPVRRQRAREHRVRPAGRHARRGGRGGGRARSAPTRSSRRCPTATTRSIAERGGRLSIGQRQLVAFARALLANPRLLILDEATSSVDIATEARIEEALETLLAGPHGVRRGTPSLDDPACGSHRGVGEWCRGGGGNARRAHCARGSLPVAVW